jgi:dimethylhistidine N-methyltransferase
MLSTTTTSVATNADFYRAVVHGLSLPNKSLPCKYLYDKRGSRLFDQICETEEYYPARTELAIMQKHAKSMARHLDRQVMLVEYGSGSSLKSRVLLNALQAPAAYVPVDISDEHLLKTAAALQEIYPHLDVIPVIADFTRPFELPHSVRPFRCRVLYFPGSTMGNFTPQAAGQLLQNMAAILGPDGGGLLIGIDLQKDVSIIEAAYNDAQGITAAFNLNLLQRINHELGGNFNSRQFEHRAIYNRQLHRVEISLVSRTTQQVQLGNHTFHFTANESILTEYSHKYTVEGFSQFAAQYGFRLNEYWSDERDFFGVLHLVLAP